MRLSERLKKGKIKRIFNVKAKGQADSKVTFVVSNVYMMYVWKVHVLCGKVHLQKAHTKHLIQHESLALGFLRQGIGPRS